MATKIGTSKADYLSGTRLADTLKGLAENDRLIGNSGNDVLDGGSGSDLLEGGRGNDQLIGGLGDDLLLGGLDQDKLSGGSGDDRLLGEDGADTLFGGTGADQLFGGFGRDLLSGGANADTFVFDRGESGITRSTADVITDWSPADQIEMVIAGTSSNYKEARTTASSMEAAASYAEKTFTSTSTAHVFLYNEKTDTGYLLSDLNNDDVFETGVVLTGAGAASQFSFQDIKSSAVGVEWKPGDEIDLRIAGSSSNYKEAGTTATSIEAAAAFAEQKFTSSTTAHVFLYNARTDTGYLISDLDNDNTFEMGIVLKGAGAASDFSYNDII